MAWPMFQSLFIFPRWVCVVVQINIHSSVLVVTPSNNLLNSLIDIFRTDFRLYWIFVAQFDIFICLHLGDQLIRLELFWPYFVT